MSTTPGCFKALLALSGNPDLEVARHDLLASIRARDLKEVIKHALNRGVSRASLSGVAAQLLDDVATATAAKAIQEVEEDNEDDAQVSMPGANLRVELHAVSL
jgi:ribosomal protein L12E/L44/L45/RPP1/RPP2